ncbi:AAA domain-containing protein [Helicobacter suis]|uniref:AAA domain-containing protein n=1 Tax=Helicobacter suis TaxID=104628 RepID=UPI0013D89A79|nr:AAA domain-containing protein [Helicobacter suis]
MLELKNIQTATCLKDIEVLDCNIKEHLEPPKNIQYRPILGFLDFEKGELHAQDKWIKVKFCHKGQEREVRDFGQRRPVSLARIKNIHKPKNPKEHQILILDVIFFREPLKYEDREIAINDSFNTKLKEYNHSRETLKEICTLEINKKSYFIISRPNVLEDIKRPLKKSKDSKKEGEKEEEAFRETSYFLYANGLVLGIKEEEKAWAQDVECIGEVQDDRLILVEGALEFKDHTTQAIRKQLLANQDTGNYLSVWEDYLVADCNDVLEKVRSFHCQEIKQIKHIGVEKVEITLENTQNLKKGDLLCLHEKIPNELDELQKINLEDKQAVLKFMSREDKGLQEQSILKNIDIVEFGKVEAETKQGLEKLRGRFLSVDYQGKKSQFNRQYKALKKAQEGKSANPNLFLVLDIESKNETSQEDLKNILTSIHAQPILALSQKVKDKIFKNPPTKTQEKAIKIALNTPDIAIIQGPPGTGKTTVINAICERLYEEASTQDLKGLVLVCAHGHDATENVQGRINVGSLPTQKFGEKQGKEDEEGNHALQEFLEKIANNAKAQIQDFSQKELINKLEKALNQYKQAPLALAFLELVGQECRSVLNLDAKLQDKWESLKTQFSPKPHDIGQLAPIYAIRTLQESFCDDGLVRHQEFLYSPFKEALDEKEKELLQATQPDFKKLQALRQRLLERCTPKPHFSRAKCNEDVIDFANTLLDKLKSRTPTDKISQILLEYVNKLENSTNMRSFLTDYSFVFASTTGQVEKALNAKAKQVFNDKEDRRYFDTVIVDEAARILPLDLLLVMVRATKRIILVGDHRQLPPIIEDKILDKIKSGKDEEARAEIEDQIKSSIFGKLKERAKELEAIDGKERQITLNQQYRTHPILGQLVSKVFYEPYAEGYKSPLDATHFKHPLIEGKPCAWVDVPKSDEKEGISWMSKTEAKRILELYKEFYQQAPNLSYGIITFYKAQKETLYKEFEKLENFNALESCGKLRIGTIDAFQGMEFDIVFLSMVRSYFSEFLKDPHRLCVAMSRQKKALIVVGNFKFFDQSQTKEQAPGIYAFIELCKQEGRIYENSK